MGEVRGWRGVGSVANPVYSYSILTPPILVLYLCVEPKQKVNKFNVKMYINVSLFVGLTNLIAK